LVYIRHRTKIRKEKQDDTFSVLMAVPSVESASWMVTVARIFSNENMALKALVATPISDRPSSYLFSELKSTITETSLLGGKKEKHLLSDIKTQSKKSGFSVTFKPIASANLAYDIANYAETHPCNLLMYDTTQHFEAPSSPSQNRLDLISSRIGNTGTKLLDIDTSSKMVKTALKYVHPPVSVLVNKGLDHPTGIDNILFLYNGTADEQVALDLVLSVKGDIRLIIMTKHDVPTNLKRDNFEIIQSDDPMLECIDSAKKYGVELIILGSSRFRSEEMFQSNPVVNSPCSVLLIFPGLVVQVQNRLEDDMEMQHTTDLPV